MRSTAHGAVAGNSKLRGKIGKTLSCGCCDLMNFRWKYRWQQAQKEITNES